MKGLRMKSDHVPATGFAISEYHDTSAIYRQAAALLAKPPLGLKPKALEAYLQY